jgi:hypothetical protein
MNPQTTFRPVAEVATKSNQNVEAMDGGPAIASFPALLARMTPQERLDAYRHGSYARRECLIWAARYPEEPPIVNGEYEWIARDLADLE